MISATVKLYGILTRYPQGGRATVQVDLPEPATAGELLERLGVPLSLLANLVLNGRQVDPEAPVAEGDVLEAFPYCAGGRGTGYRVRFTRRRRCHTGTTASC